MRLIVDESLFIGAIDDLQLLGLFGAAIRHNHRLTVDPEHKSTFEKWLSTLGLRIADDCRTLIAISEQEEAIHPSTRVVRVGRVAQLTGSTPTVLLPDANRLLERPFYLFTEGPRVDRDFLLAMMTPDERAYFQQICSELPIESVHCGGIGEIGATIRARIVDVPLGNWFCYALFDSDALYPAAPSADAERAANDCTSAGVEFLRLHRRTIENYIPPATLKSIAAGIPRKTTRERALAQANAFGSMSDPQRHHYNVKKGFGGDTKRIATESGPVRTAVGQLYEGVDSKRRTLLETGFGTGIAKVFSEKVSETELRRDGGWLELRPAVQRLFELLR